MRKSVALIAAALFSFFAFIGGHEQALALAPSIDQNDVVAYAHVLRTINPKLQFWQSRDLAAHVLHNAAQYNVDANLLVAIVTVESHWRPAARSRVGALGLGQLMPGTAHTLGVNPRNADQNLAGCAHYLSGLIAKYGNRANQYALAFAAYNAGPKAVDRYHGIPPYSETQQYVVRVMTAWHHFTHLVRVPAMNREMASAVTTVAPQTLTPAAADWVNENAAPETTTATAPTDDAPPTH